MHESTLAHETDLIRAAQAGDGTATAALLDAYAPGIKRAARRFAEALGPEDAAQEAMCAFLECLRDFDPDGELKLVQVFGNKLLGALGEAAAGEEAFRIPPREYRRFLAAIKDADGDVSLALSRAEGGRHGLTRRAFLDILAATRGTRSLDELREDRYSDGPYPTTGEQKTVDIESEPLYPANPMYRPTMPTPSEIADVHYALSVVDDRERMICRYAYGFVETRPTAAAQFPAVLPDADIAELMPIPTERGRHWTRKTVNDSRNKALDKMRAALIA